jgi:hypothetical protein
MGLEKYINEVMKKSNYSIPSEKVTFIKNLYYMQFSVDDVVNILMGS